MKIGIITFHASFNCGSILQCFALKEILNRLGYEPEIINFSSKEQQKLYSVFYKKLNAKNIVKNILCIPGYFNIKKHYLQYERYICNIFNVDRNFLQSNEELKVQYGDFDILIAGGDQVWNVKCDDFDTAYMLDFSDTAYKFSYSPSLGATNINETDMASKCKALLDNFDSISCREINGAKWLQELTNRDITLAADPTMLLGADEWRKVLDKNFKLKYKNFVFYYAFAYSAENNAVINKIAKEQGLDVIVIDAKQWYIKKLYMYSNFILCEKTGPEAFLWLMDHAKYVITTSFHGSVFSILYNKQFSYIKGIKHNPKDDRTSFLLERLGLMQRHISINELSTEQLCQSINYDDINNKVNELRKESMLYLVSNLNSAKRKKGVNDDVS